MNLARDEITQDNRDLDQFISDLAKLVVDRHLTAPAIMILESSKPLTFAGSQAIIFFQPLLSMLSIFRDHDKFQQILEDRNRLEQLIVAIENYEDEKIRMKKVNKDEKRGD